MRDRRSLTAILLYSSSLALGCLNPRILDDVDHSEHKERVYSGAEAELAYCLVDSGIMHGFGDNGYRSEKQGKVFGEEAWKVMQEAYTECFQDGNQWMIQECKTYFGFDDNVNKNIFPIWVFLNEEGGFVVSGVLTLENFASLTSQFGCRYEHDK